MPPIALGLAKHPDVDKYDLSSLRMIMSGAAPLSADLQKLLASRLPKALVLQGYGMTETTSVALLPDPQDLGLVGNCGRLLGGMEARLVDEEYKDVKEGEAGELLLRGPVRFLFYTDTGVLLLTFHFPEHHDSIPQEPGGYGQDH